MSNTNLPRAILCCTVAPHCACTVSISALYDAPTTSAQPSNPHVPSGPDKSAANENKLLLLVQRKHCHFQRTRGPSSEARRCPLESSKSEAAMSHNAAVLEQPIPRPDYSLTGVNATLAIERGLAEADWYQCPVPRETMRQLLVRRDGPAIRDTILWIALLIGSGLATWKLWGTWWAILPYFVYSVLYGTGSDSRWHECGHGTAFRSDWMNIAVYEIASFMVLRESVLWRWCHSRHHSDTIVVGRDPEIWRRAAGDSKSTRFPDPGRPLALGGRTDGSGARAVSAFGGVRRRRLTLPCLSGV